MKIGIKNLSPDLFIILIWTILASIFVIIPYLKDSIFRTILGIPIVLFIPGYVLISAIFPKNNDLEGIERIALSFGSSFAIIPILGLLLNFTVGISLIPILMILCINTVILIYVAEYRRGKIPEDARFNIPFREIYSNTILDITPKCRKDIILTGILIFTSVLVVGMAYIVVTTPKIGERFTEFYLLNISGRSDYYQNHLKVDQPVAYLVGVSNHEYTPVNYTLEVSINKDVLTTNELILNHDQKWEKKITIIPDKEFNDTKLEFWLFKENNFTEPYRKLFLLVNVTK